MRGGGELGRRWYEDGKLAAKPHTFSDFIACARHLVAQGWTTPDRLGARGGSAGGLLMGAVINQAPELFGAVVAEVPFVDVPDHHAGRDPPAHRRRVGGVGQPGRRPRRLRCHAGLLPLRQRAGAAPRRDAGALPRLLATAGLHDSRVGFWEPAKWVARLRAANPENQALLRTELVAGHAGPSGRYDAWRDEALVYAFLIDALAPAATGTAAVSRPAAGR